MKSLRFVTTLFLIILLAGCALQPSKQGIYYAGVRTQFSDPVVIPPAKPSLQKVYIQQVNTTGVATISNLKNYIAQQMQLQGFKVVNSESQANYIIKAKILLAGVTTLQAADDILLQGFEGRARPAGEITLKPKNYYDIVTKTPTAYAVVVDLSVWQKASLAMNPRKNNKVVSSWDRYNTRILSTYAHQLNPAKFSQVEPTLATSIARVIAAMF